MQRVKGTIRLSCTFDNGFYVVRDKDRDEIVAKNSVAIIAKKKAREIMWKTYGSGWKIRFDD